MLNSPCWRSMRCKYKSVVFMELDEYQYRSNIHYVFLYIQKVIFIYICLYFNYVFLHFNVMKTMNTCADFFDHTTATKKKLNWFGFVRSLWNTWQLSVESVITFLLLHGLEICPKGTRMGCITVKVASRTTVVILPELRHILSKRVISETWKIFECPLHLWRVWTTPLWSSNRVRRYFILHAVEDEHYMSKKITG